ncbi:nitric oxide synthase-related [Anaeramoeba flamelloides]|uniref:NADPH--hemoprotein reductase n=1 Tax=Anaeramoeba flamelloides TaxID=1746091 RepID=A0AAV7YFD4_9EUKA|nr:nitric oxide synthase-related [Anaeramoeba flamelloides]
MLDKKFSIFFGTQTGTAEEFAEDLTNSLKELGVKCSLHDLEDYDPKHLPSEEYTIFIISTYGEGEPPDNAIDFYNYIHDDDHPKTYLSSMNYTVFGLGDSTYETFNYCARNVKKKFDELGARLFFKIGYGDDDDDIESDFLSWKTNLIEFLKSSQTNTSTKTTKKTTTIKHIEYEFLETNPEKKAFRQDNNTSIQLEQKIKFSKIISSQELHTKKSKRSAKLVKFDISNLGLNYNAGDHIGIYPENSIENVKRVYKLLKIENPGKVFILKEKTKNSFLTKYQPCTIKEAISNYCDLTSPPTRILLSSLIPYITNQDLIKYISSLTNLEKNEFQDFLQNKAHTILETFEFFSESLNIDLGDFFGLCPSQTPRFYSIASSPLETPNEIHIVFINSVWYTNQKKKYLGLCTSFISQFSNKDDKYVPVFIRHSEFRLPNKNQIQNKSIIMVGPGTGFAPFRGFIQELAIRKKEKNSQIGNITLFFGCRNREEDFILQDEMQNAKETGILDNLFVSFSREQKEKIYVQNKMLENKQIIWNCIRNNGYFYICGDAKKMAKGVINTLFSICSEMGGEKGEQLFYSLKNNKRLLEDVW